MIYENKNLGYEFLTRLRLNNNTSFLNMLPYFMAICFLIATNQIFAQEKQIDIFQSVKTFPANPSTDDEVKLIIHTIQPSSFCYFDSTEISMKRNKIDLTLYYRSFACPTEFERIDTLNIGKLPIGKYELRSNLFTIRNAGIPTSTDEITLDFKVELYSLTELSSDNEVSVYPNPFKNVIQFKNPNEEKHNITILNSVGKIVLKSTIISKFKTMDLSELQKGVYLIRLSNENYTKSMKIVKD